MNIGDKIYCKKTYEHFIKNSDYKIICISRISPFSDRLFYTISSERYINTHGQTENSMVISQKEVNNIFYSKQEYRKIKLEKLNSI